MLVMINWKEDIWSLPTYKIGSLVKIVRPTRELTDLERQFLERWGGRKDYLLSNVGKIGRIKSFLTYIKDKTDYRINGDIVKEPFKKDVFAIAVQYNNDIMWDYYTLNYIEEL
jgi:hypothetical protein